MTEENIIKLTNALYKVTGLFPKDEPLKFAIRKEALDVLFFTALIKGDSLTISREDRKLYFKRAAGKIDLIGTYFDIAITQDWVNEKNFAVLREEYGELKDIFEFEGRKAEAEERPQIAFRKDETMGKEEPEEEEEPERKEKVVDPEKKTEREAPERIEHLNYEDLSNVQLKVLEILQGKGQLKSNQISQFFPEMNPRTIRRELKGLKELKIIIANGAGKTTVYEINKAS